MKYINIERHSPKSNVASDHKKRRHAQAPSHIQATCWWYAVVCQAFPSCQHDDILIDLLGVHLPLAPDADGSPTSRLQLWTAARAAPVGLIRRLAASLRSARVPESPAVTRPPSGPSWRSSLHFQRRSSVRAADRHGKALIGAGPGVWNRCPECLTLRDTLASSADTTLGSNKRDSCKGITML